MKNRGFIIALIILLSFIIIFLISFLYNALTGNFDFKNLNNIFEGETTNLIIDKSYDIEEIENLKIKSNLGDIKLKVSEDSAVKCEIYGKDVEDVEINLNDKELDITYNKKGISLFGSDSYKRDIILFIPEEYSGNVNINSDCGDIEISDLKNISLDIKQECGDVDIGEVKTLLVENALGDVKVKRVTDKCVIESDCGDIKIENVEIKEDSSIRNDLGDVKIEKINNIYIDAETDLGEVEINSDNNKNSDIRLEIECDCGDIKIGN